ncbi:prenyltransferase/squalene oxidase repeat-containing protein [Chitinophaga vietnamensis]|uniref:hypothetical protein n=1 Tax=Chitinophaga vietnamensis TaxID=2593957 RepID=UPI001177F89D|nr:hypothetical protein [Chitinophaga vietnamensis]
MKQAFDEYSLLKATGDFCDSLPQALVSPAQLPLLKTAADFFPPLIRFGLECRLDHHEQVDLQLCIRRDEDDLPALSDWVQNKFAGNLEHEHISHFFKTWADQLSSYHKNITEVFLELDVLPSGVKTPLLFFELQPGLDDIDRKDVCFTVLKETLGEDRSFYDLFETIFHACPPPAYIAYLGIMFSRDVDVLRVNIKKLPMAAVAPFLEKIGYAWTGPTLDRWISFVHSYADRVTLCIDIGKNVFPKIGFECFWDKQPPIDTYWRFFIEKINTCHHYKKDKIEAILNWDKEIFPGQTNDWPEHLWIASLRKPENEFTFLKRKLSHLKLSYCPDKEIALKAYLGYGSLWMVKKNLGLKTEKKAHREHVSLSAIQQAIAKGIDHLLSNQQQSGWWKDFYVKTGISDEWVTAYVACHLARLKHPGISEALDRAWRILKTRYREQEGWGYNVLNRADADSTIWTWLFANTATFADEFPEPGFDMMNRYVAANGGVITYDPNVPVGKYNMKTDGQHFNGWQIPHHCVTAAYALAGQQDAIDYLLANQHTEGYWYSYWWNGPEYATALTVEALFNKDADKYKKEIDMAVGWACNKARKELDKPVPNDFKIALLLKIISCSYDSEQHHELVKAMLNDLLHAQQPAGYWNPSAELRIPETYNTDHENGENIFVTTDERKNFATVTILDALNKYARLNVSW